MSYMQRTQSIIFYMSSTVAYNLIFVLRKWQLVFSRLFDFESVYLKFDPLYSKLLHQQLTNPVLIGGLLGLHLATQFTLHHIG